MENEINLWIVLPLSTLVVFLFAGLYLLITLSVIKNDPREIKYKKDKKETK